MKKGLVLYIDDDAGLQIVITQYLEEDGYEVISAQSVGEAMEIVTNDKPDIILLDLTLPDGEGMTLIPQIQAISQAGIIVVSGKTETTEKIVCLEMGADDYLTKPFEMRELSARIKAVARRQGETVVQDNDMPIEKTEKLPFIKGWVLDRSQYQLFDEGGASKDLTTGEFKLLEALVLSENKALTREKLFDLTRDGEFEAYDRAIDIQIARIRKKIDDNAEDHEYIKTIRGVGYMYVSKAA